MYLFITGNDCHLSPGQPTASTSRSVGMGIIVCDFPSTSCNRLLLSHPCRELSQIFHPLSLKLQWHHQFFVAFSNKFSCYMMQCQRESCSYNSFNPCVQFLSYIYIYTSDIAIPELRNVKNAMPGVHARTAKSTGIGHDETRAVHTHKTTIRIRVTSHPIWHHVEIKRELRKIVSRNFVPTSQSRKGFQVSCKRQGLPFIRVIKQGGGMNLGSSSPHRNRA